MTARKTALVLRQVIAAERKPAPYQASQLIELVKNYGRKLMDANPTGEWTGHTLVALLHRLAHNIPIPKHLRLVSPVPAPTVLQSRYQAVASAFNGQLLFTLV